MAYKLETFLNPLTQEDKNLFIYDDTGSLVYTINPFSITNIQIRGNILYLNIKSGRTILLDFLNKIIAQEAFPILQNRVYDLTRKVPNFIDKKIENWISNEIVTSTFSGTFSGGDIGPQGPSGPSGMNTRNDPFSNVLQITITHSTGYFPVVQTIDDNNNVFIPKSIIHNSSESVTVIFITHSSGNVLISGGAGPIGNTGITGPQGPASGGSGSVSITTNQVAFGDGTGITSSSIFIFSPTSSTFLVAQSSTISNSCNSSIIGGYCNALSYSNCSIILGGNNLTLASQSNTALTQNLWIAGSVSPNCGSDFGISGCFNSISSICVINGLIVSII